MAKRPLILKSELTSPPRYYVTRAWRYRGGETADGQYARVEVTGQKFDITDQIEEIIKARTASIPERDVPEHIIDQIEQALMDKD